MLDPSISPKSKKGKRKKGKKGFMLPGQSSHMHMDANEYRVPGHSGTVSLCSLIVQSAQFFVNCDVCFSTFRFQDASGWKGKSGSPSCCACVQILTFIHGGK